MNRSEARSQTNRRTESSVYEKRRNANRKNQMVEEEEEVPVKRRGRNSKSNLKNKITTWLDNDDKIKELNRRSKKYKDAKKKEEKIIMEKIGRAHV